jgi:hypothetical protein
MVNLDGCQLMKIYPKNSLFDVRKFGNFRFLFRLIQYANDKTIFYLIRICS